MLPCVLVFVILNQVFSSIIVDEVWKYTKNEYAECSGHGNLDSNGFCKCSPFYFGEECSITDCDGLMSNGTETCFGNGLCIFHDFCVCLSGYYGKYCDVTSCFGINSTNSSTVCSGNGECKNINTCTCDRGFYGSECQFKNTSFTHIAAMSNDNCPNNTLDSIYQMKVEYSTCHSDGEFDTRILCSTGQPEYEIEKYQPDSTCEAYNFIEFENSMFPECQVMDTKPEGNLFYSQLCGDFISSFEDSELLHNGFVLRDHIESSDCSDPPITSEYFKYGVCVGMEEKNVIMKCLDNGNRIYSDVYNDGNCTDYNQTEFYTDVEVSSCQNNHSYLTSSTGCYTDCFGNYSWNPTTVCSNRGVCVDLNNCSCDEGFFGSRCEIWTCWNITYNETDDVCSGHGSCTDYNHCECITGFHGKNCETHFWEQMGGTYETEQPAEYSCLETTTTPGGRYDGGQFYVDPLNRFWLFGGLDTSGSYNDVWFYFNGKWCFAKGEEGAVGSPGLPPGESGVFLPSALPPSSHSHNLFGTRNLVSFFVFGGDRPPDGVPKDTNELWEFNYVFREWRIIRGFEESYEESGVPGPRRHACVVLHQNWTSSFAYIFGGQDKSRSGGAYNDLWSYDVMNDTFTHLTGSYYNISQTNVSFSELGEKKGVFSETSIPQPRSGSSCWMSKDHIYVFGGMYVYDEQFGVSNDMWVYNTTLGLWGYLFGNRTVQNRNMIEDIYEFGNDTVNVPGARRFMSFWKLSFDMFYVFGGISMENKMFGDMWVYDISTNFFKFENGTYEVDVYPTLHTMGSRYHSFAGMDESKRVKIFGGITMG